MPKKTMLSDEQKAALDAIVATLRERNISPQRAADDPYLCVIVSIYRRAWSDGRTYPCGGDVQAVEHQMQNSLDEVITLAKTRLGIK